jgi:cyclase
MNLAFLGSIREVTGLPITHLFITHHHPDHVQGIQYFLPTNVICHPACREEIVRNGPDAHKKWGKLRPHFAPDITGIRICIPDQTLDGKLTFYLGSRRVEVMHLGAAHTYGDLLVYLPEEKVLFAGDLMFYKVAPWVIHGCLGGWLKVADRMLALGAETIVPGHGPIGGKAELAEFRDCLTAVYEGARRGFDTGLPEAEAFAAIDLGRFRDWIHPERHPDNLVRAYWEFRGEVTDSYAESKRWGELI